MTISYAKIKKYAFALLTLPSVVFALGFLKWWIAVPVTALVLVAFVWALKKGKKTLDAAKLAKEEAQLVLPRWQCWTLLGVLLLWCVLSGLGNLYYQTSDWGARNAIFRDLIRFDWPVIYESKGAALVYYIGFWLPPALIGKFFLWVGCDITAAFAIGNIALLLWSVAHLFVVFLLLMLFVRADSKKRFFAALLMMIGFSGLDIVGALLSSWTTGTHIPSHLEWWTHYQFTSMAACLGWVFNQAVPAWLTVSCFLHEKTMRNYAFLAVLCAAGAPLPCVGIVGYMGAILVIRAIKAFREKKAFALVSEVLTPQNLIAALVLLPLWMTYYLSNMAISAEASFKQTEIDYLGVAILLTVGVAATIGTVILYRKKKDWVSLAIPAVALLAVGVLGFFYPNVTGTYAGALLLESGIYLALLWWSNKHIAIYRVAIVYAVLVPLIRIGTDYDFCMRASVPTVFILMVLCVRFLFEHEDCITFGSVEAAKRVPRVLCLVLIGVMLIGSVTMLAELRNGFAGVMHAGKLNAVNDSIYTFDQIFTGERFGADRNFIAANYRQTFFFQYLAK
ncbi:MAG: hypothetical protein E7585_06595 [Ruminococcaceae bacterium]|nr:hypothetical protein [Oscillospiraceae bacterium]